MGLKNRNFSLSAGRIKLRTFLALIGFGLVLVGLLAPSSTPATAAAGINGTVNFQGRLLSNVGAVVSDGNYNMQFIIYQDGDGTHTGNSTGAPATTKLWTESWLFGNSQGVAVKNGYFSVNLGSLCSLTAGGTCQGNANSAVNFNSDTLFLSMNIAGGGNAHDVNCGTTTATFISGCSPDLEMLPMKRLASAVYAFNSSELNGLTSGQYVQDAPSSATPNTGTPTNATPALTLNGSGTANLAFALNQSGAADGVNIV